MSSPHSGTMWPLETVMALEVGSRVPRGLAKFEGAFRAFAGQALASEMRGRARGEELRSEVCILLALPLLVLCCSSFSFNLYL